MSRLPVPVAFMGIETDFDPDGHHWVHDPDNCPCGVNRPEPEPHAYVSSFAPWIDECRHCRRPAADDVHPMSGSEPREGER